jgi:biopolymer transport protein TolQ
VNEAVEVYLAATRATEGEAWTAGSAIAWAIVIAVLLVLVAMSLVSWAIIFQKIGRLRAASSLSDKFLELFWASKRLDAVYEKVPAYRGSPIAEVFRAGYQELAKVSAAGNESGRKADATDNLTRTLRRAAAAEATALERNVTFLATTASTGPFIGLFGTVVGILAAFNKLGSGGGATIDVVGPDIGFALISTAVGLAAAIPAVAAYNSFNNSIRVLTSEMDNFSADFLNIVKRQLS